MAFVENLRGYVSRLFPEQIDFKSLPDQLAFVHIDTDLYRPTLDGLNTFYPKLAKGGVMLIDDYGNPSCPGVK